MKVVLLPGLDGTGILFRPFIELLSREIKVQVISYPADNKMSYTELVGFVLSKLPKEDFILVGESFSGPITYQVALHKPEHLRSVIFVATFLSAPKKKLLNLTKILPVKLFFNMPIPNVIVKKYLFGSGIADEIIKLFKKSLKIVPSGVLSFRLNEISRLKGNQQPCDIKATYVQATDDKLVPDSSVEEFRKVCKNLTILRVEGTHFILQTNPSACAEIVENEIRLIIKRSSLFRSSAST
jgi:pimeloyl-ACP methyl ester carboxylesterase